VRTTPCATSFRTAARPLRFRLLGVPCAHGQPTQASLGGSGSIGVVLLCGALVITGTAPRFTGRGVSDPWPVWAEFYTDRDTNAKGRS
jgi:hypothetical protein